MAPVRVGETVDETVEDATFADGCASVDGAWALKVALKGSEYEQHVKLENEYELTSSRLLTRHFVNALLCYCWPKEIQQRFHLLKRWESDQQHQNPHLWEKISHAQDAIRQMRVDTSVAIFIADSAVRAREAPTT